MITPQRHKLGIRFGWWRDRQCRRSGHVPSECNAVEYRGFWLPICERCGRGANR